MFFKSRTNSKFCEFKITFQLCSLTQHLLHCEKEDHIQNYAKKDEHVHSFLFQLKPVTLIGVKANRIKYLLRATLCLAILFGLGGCAGFHGVMRKTGLEYDSEIQSWQRAIEGKGGNGMWLVTRGYRGGDNLVAISTCSYFSHVGILDHDRNVVIESLWSGNVETPLRDFLRISHRVVLIQPKGWTPEKGANALTKVRTQLGKKYDFQGLIGFPSSNRWYCSELAAWSWDRQSDRFGPWHVIHPRRHLKMGRTLFKSGPRNGQPDEIPSTSIPLR